MAGAVNEEGSDEKLVLYRVVGFDPGGGGWGQGMTTTLYSARGGRPIERHVPRSEGRWYQSDSGARIGVTSHRRGDQAEFGRLWAWTPRNPYAATKRGQQAAMDWDSSRPFPGDIDVEWSRATFVVDGVETEFELCDLGEGIWGAIGRLPEVDVTIDSRGVPPSDVELARLGDGERLVLRMPDLGEVLRPISTDLDDRSARVPFGRVRRWGDYWALTGIEREHVELLSARFGLSATQRNKLEAHWIGRIDAELSETLERLHYHSHDGLLHWRARRMLRWNWLYQLWFNTFGPGARTWFGNRYATIRPYTFRLRWRP